MPLQIGTVVTAVDLNPLYCDFIPLFLDAWKCVLPEADVRIVLIAECVPTALAPYTEHIVRHSPISGLHDAFHAQCVRLLYPREVARDEGVLITDIDMLPMNRRYYEQPIRAVDADAFVVYRDILSPHEIPMCYNAARPSTWTSMFGTGTRESILSGWWAAAGYEGVSGGRGWNSDQVALRRAFNRWAGRRVVLNDRTTGFRRLDRSARWSLKRLPKLRDRIISGYFSDYHCLRPYQDHRAANDFIASCLGHLRHT